ncbi:MAG TPA: PqqD family protein [Polyangiaceae bacterium]|nr:PqqD family protein [Polyangiaceae bacterium]
MSESATLVESLRAHPKCLLTELDDGTGVVLNLDTKFYFTLNTTAVVLWKELARGARTRRELAESLVQEFEVESAQADTDVSQLVDELLAEGLLERVI